MHIYSLYLQRHLANIFEVFAMRTYICISLLFTGLIGLGLCDIKMTPLRLVYLGLVEVQCPDGGSCADGNTCCKISDSRYGCCPHPNAVCCTDMKHCCPSGTTCNLPNGTCDRVEEVKEVKEVEEVKEVKEVTCPGGSSQCPDKTTCCPVGNNKYGCCPLEKAVCCPDKKHCCPADYTCDPNNTCKKKEFNMGSWW